MVSDRVYVFVRNHHHPDDMTSEYNHRFAPPISREGFSCSGPSDEDFYVSLPSDPTSRYSRADPSYLYFLLTYTEPLRPILSTSGTVTKIQPPSHKDKSQGFYCAQLMHYGRKALKTKAAAKKELLAAFGEEGGLRIPERIERLRREMLKEYVELNERALEEEAERKEAEGNGKGKGRKVVAKRKLVTRDDATDEARTSVAAPPKRRKQAAVKAFATGSVPSSQRPGAGSVGATSNDEVRTLSHANVIHQRTRPTPHDIYGHYDIVSPFLSTNTDLSDDLPPLSLHICSSPGPSHHIWISFSFGSTSGIMRSIGSCPASLANNANPGTSTTTSTFTLTFTWRGTSTLPNGSQHLSFGSDHAARITFLGSDRNSTAANHDRILKGSISGGRLGKNVEFMGTRFKGVHSQMASLRISDPDVGAWKRRYRAINAKTQQMLLAVKWGQQSASAGSSNIFEGSDEGPAGSDTSFPGNEYHRDDVDEDEDYNMIEDND